MNMNEVAKEVTIMEGGKISISIAQVKEVLKCTRILLKSCSGKDLYSMFRLEKECKNRCK